MKNLNIITMKKLIKTLLSLIAVFALVFSCTDLDEELQGQITTDISLEGIDTGESAGGGGYGNNNKGLMEHFVLF